MKKLWKEILDQITPYEPGRPIEEVKRELGLDKVIKLASNENPLGPSEKVMEAINAAAKDVNRYPDGGCFYLREAISAKLSVPGEKIVFGNGSDDGRKCAPAFTFAASCRHRTCNLRRPCLCGLGPSPIQF